MKPPGKVLLFAYYFPPASGVASERMASFHRHLPTFGWEPTVLTPRSPHFHQATAPATKDGTSVVRTPAPELSRLFRRVYAGSSKGPDPREEGGILAPLETGPTGSILRSLVREWLYVPDAQVGWISPLLRASAEILRGDGIQDWVIFSSSVPYSAHLAAARLSARFHLPWVAEFRDPWSTQDPDLLPRTALRRGLDRRMEADILRKAHRVVVTAESTRTLLLDAFPHQASGKVAVVTNGFEPLPVGAPPGPGDPMTLVHAGTLHDSAFAEPILRAMASTTAGLGNELQLVVVGDDAPWKRALDALGLGRPSWLVWRGVVDSQRAREAIQNASVLLLPAPHPRFRRILLGKLLTYLGARRPILGVVPEGSEMDRVLESSADGRMVRPWDAQGVRQALARLLEEHRLGTLQAPRVEEDRVLRFTRENQAGALADLFDQVREEGTAS